jgi:nicotinate-nucleotide--dimethylbenzimidazole phosphoribosyltransferase
LNSEILGNGLLEQTIAAITPVSEAAARAAAWHLDDLVKPIGSLGRLEDIGIQIAAITGQTRNRLDKKAVAVFAADNGICAEGVSTAPQAVTKLQFLNMARGVTGIMALCRQAGADVYLVDVGIKETVTHERIINKKVRYGTANMLREPAMTRAEAVAALEVGISTAADLAAQGYELLGAGEMGIGNTSTSGAVLMALTGCGVDDAVGMGAGMTKADYEHKKNVLAVVLANRRPNPADPLDVLSQVGGLDIAALAGFYLGAAAHRLPVVTDGFISLVAALLACRWQPLTRGYLLPSHLSAEAGAVLAQKELGLEAYLHLNMRLGEGTGCPLAFQLIDSALAACRDMATFAEGNIDNGALVDIRS